jgi:hypothetical protein
VYCKLTLALSFICAACPILTWSQQLRVLSAGVVSSDGGAHEWYTVEADPENAANLITCGMMWNARDNANYGFVYASQDAGTTWHSALEDKSSKYVSEESCAFGMHGVAYFVADAWKEDDLGNIIRPDLGTTRIWVSRDSGRTWSVGAHTGWTDCSSSVVDRSPGPNQNQLYVFFNSLQAYYSNDRKSLATLPQLADQAGSSVGLISYKDGDQKVAGPIFNPEMYKELYHGTFTHQNLMLNDGSLLALFWSKVSKETGRAFLLAAQHTDPARTKLSDPVILFRVPSNAVCNSFLSAPAVYNPTSNTVYATYLDGSNGKCKLMLTKSTDDGQTWSTGHVWTEAKELKEESELVPTDTYSSFALARNQEGVMALIWRSSHTSNCWYLAVSTDDGETYSHPMQLSSCSPEKEEKYHLSDAYLGFGGLDQPDESKPGDDADITIKNTYNSGESHVSGIAVSRDGVFHPVWIASEHGEGQLRTAAVAVIKAHDRHALELAPTEGWQYETNKVKFLYGGSQHYDVAKGVLTESIIVRNSSTETLRAPLRMEIDPRSGLGRIYPLGVTTEGSGQNIAQYLDISQYLPGDELPPGRSSAPILLSFHLELNNDAKPSENELAHISLRLLTKDAR